MKFLLQTRRRRIVYYALTIIAGMLTSCVILGMIGYNSNQRLPSGPAITGRMETLDKLRLAEALHLKASLGEQIWPGFAGFSAPVIVWNEDYEFLFGVSEPPAGWEMVPGDSFEGQPYFRRLADDPQNFAVRVGEEWAASIFTKYLVDAGLTSAIRELLPPLIAEVFPYRIILQPSEVQISAVQHEYFHVVQAEMASQKFAQVEAVYPSAERYWDRDDEMQPAWRAEIDLLIEAVQSGSDSQASELARQFLAQRDQRRQDFRLEADLVAYERLLEWLEGTAKYVELRSWEEAFRDHGYLPLPQMEADPDFKGYETFEARWKQELSQARRQAGQTGEVRFYYTGMLQAHLLDRLLPDWKTRIMEEGVFLEDLLREALGP